MKSTPSKMLDSKDWKTALLKAATGVYDVLITVDRNIPHQQSVAGKGIAVMVIAAKRATYSGLKPLLPSALKALETINPGDVVLIEG